MAIIDAQRRLHEAGRIRIGEQVSGSGGRSHPRKLGTFRFTSPNQDAIKAIAGIMGGDVRPWEGPAGRQWEVITDSDNFRVLVPPAAMAFSQWYELWSGGGCVRRCDGQRQVPSEEPCACDADARSASHTRGCLSCCPPL